MKKSVFVFVVVVYFIFSFFLEAQLPGVKWNTFLGGGDEDYGISIVTNSTGNHYLAGMSLATWGTPLNAYSGGYDVFVAVLDSNGNLLANSFLGCASDDYCNTIVIDSSNNIYIIGYSASTWGSPINSHSGDYDAFVAKLNNNGTLLWNTFLGSSNEDLGGSLILDGNGNIYITGTSMGSWGTPINAYSDHYDTFVAKLDNSGNLIWNTFHGSDDWDEGHGIDLDNSGDIFITGRSRAGWGTPLSGYSGGYDAFLFKLNNSGNFSWNTFFGSSNDDYGERIILDTTGNIYMSGNSTSSWGSPINPHSGNTDTFAVKFNNNGDLIWNTFFGSSGEEAGYGISLGSNNSIFVTGRTDDTWGSPINPHAGNYDAFIIKLDNNGAILFNSFLGSSDRDFGWGIITDNLDNIYVVGETDASWGNPINPFVGVRDAFVAKITPPPVPDIKANGTDGPISITQSDTLQIRVSLISNSLNSVDYWLAYKGPSGWVHYNNSTKKWETGLGVTHQGPLMDLNNKKVFQKSGLTPGNYTFYFGVDMVMDGKVTKSSLYKDEVKVTVTSN